MINDYGVRVLVAYENRRVGQIFHPPGVLRERLLKTGFVERVAPPPRATRENALARKLKDTTAVAGE